jgi:hypothetical protein
LLADVLHPWAASTLSLRLRRFSLNECLMRLPRLENVFGDRFDAPVITKQESKKKEKSTCNNGTDHRVRNI